MKLIKNVKMILSEEIAQDKAILFSDKIEKIVAEEEILAILKENEDVEVIDGKGFYLSPGFIDIHIHGSAGHDVMEGTYEAVNEISKSLIRSGVTSFLPTTMTMPTDDLYKAYDSVRSAMERGTAGAKILGVNSEGPFINSIYKGAQLEEGIKLPDKNLLEDYLDIIKLITIAPEKEGAEEVITYLTEKGIVVSAGHTGATYEEIMEAQKWGVSNVTHLFNAMTGIHHRKPGVVGAALTSRMTCELIADYIHIHPAVLKLVLLTKDLADIILITDQMEAGSLGDGEYLLGGENGQKAIVKDGAARLENGSLAGSVLTLNRAVKNIYNLGLISLPETVRLATQNPARLMKLDDKLGKLGPGYQADLVLFDKEIDIKEVYRDGKKISLE